MAGPSIESLTSMGLMERTGENTEVLTLRDEAKRKEYFDKFNVERNKDFKNVNWGIESKASGSLRCNANIALMQIGAKIPESPDDNRQANEVAPIYRYPLKALGEWGLDNLTCAHSEYKGMDRVSLSEPSRMPVPRFYDYLPKKVRDLKDEESEKFVNEFKGNNPGLAKEHVTIKYILMRCNFPMDHRADVEEHTFYTHGMEMSEVKIETRIKVNEAEALVLTPAMNFKDLSREGRIEVYDSWYSSSVANATVTSTENKDNSKIQKHKAGPFLKALKTAITQEYFNNFYYQLQRNLKEGDNLMLGFQCKWSEFEKAMEEALGPMSNVKRLKTFLNSKEHLKGGVSLANMFYRCSTLVEDTFGKLDEFTLHSDKVTRDNKGTKEYHKFRMSFEIVEALPSEYDKVSEDLMISITKYVLYRKNPSMNGQWKQVKMPAKRAIQFCTKKKLLPSSHK